VSQPACHDGGRLFYVFFSCAIKAYFANNAAKVEKKSEKWEEYFHYPLKVNIFYHTEMLPQRYWQAILVSEIRSADSRGATCQVHAAVMMADVAL
jgi:hypothetical protein